ncbi:response regulator [Magnetospirillum sp. SS-4]|uniref:response regulator n=1 Tax=Magnetospirillum sp. SS-4 TaxID=2681465 RepID=UPI00157171E5|nr:response regulator [Magnetospirillum sp. SS-4]
MIATLLLGLCAGLLAAGLWRRSRSDRRRDGTESRFASLTAVAADAVVTIDQNSVILSWNRGAEAIFGHDEAAMIGRPLHVVIPERYRAAHDGGVARLCRESAIPFSGRTRELYALRRDGSEFPIELTVSSWSGPRERLFIGIIRDITERRLIDDALRQAKVEAEQGARAKSEFLAMMSHEIRTPLNGIIGMLQLLRRSPLAPDQTDWVETIHYSSHALLSIVDDALSFSKLDSGRLELERVDFDLWRLGSSITSLMASRAEAKGVRLSMHADEAVPRRLRGDPTRLRQVLLNLVVNAIKFTDHGDVTMAVTVTRHAAAGATLHFSVADTGIGIADEAIPSLFTAYTQADSSIARRFGGTGLGLAICKKIIDAMGGRIGVHSRVGEGSTFWFEVPFEVSSRSPEEIGADPGTDEAPADFDLANPARVLVVEDNPINQRVAETLLRAMGLHVDVVGNGRLAVDAVLGDSGGYDAVLMDVDMPEMDGIAATGLIRARTGGDRLPVIGLTALAMEDEIQACRAAGMDDVITKPIDAVALRDALLRHLRHPPARPEPPPPAGGDILPDQLPPFDLAAATKRVGGNRLLLREVIVGFRQHYLHAADDLRRLIRDGSRTEAQRLAHSLRGVAGTLGATALFTAARELETAIRHGRGDPASGIAALEAVLSPALASAGVIAESETAAACQCGTATAGAPLCAKDTRVLMIDDDPLNIQVLRDILKTEHEIVVASDGPGALELARSVAPDLILLDIMMPGMNGYEVCAHLKANAATSHIPVIFLTSLGDIDAEIRGLEVGAADYVSKPISPPIIRMRIRNQIELKKAREGLTILAEIDGLTGLENRRRFDEVLEAELRRLRRSRGLLSLVLLDVDHFKAFNDSYGHVAGDDCLRQVGCAIRSVVSRSADHSARYGGEEFCIVLPETDHAGANALAERIRSIVAGLRIPHAGSDTAAFVTVSLGVLTVTCQPRDTAKDLLAMVDAQLYRAKRDGRNRIAAKRRDDES